MKTQYQYDIYDKAGIFSFTINPKIITSDLLVRSSIDSGVDSIDIRLRIDFDDPDYFAKYKDMYIVEVKEFSTFNPSGVVFFKGYISESAHRFGTNRNEITMKAVGSTGLLNINKFRNQLASFDVSYSATPLSEIIEDIIQDIQASYPNLITIGTINATGNVDLVFNNINHEQALQACIDASGADSYFTFDPDGTFNFFVPPSTPTHDFNINVNIGTLDIDITNEEVINYLEMEYNGGSVFATSPDSVTKYGLRATRINNSTTDSATAQKIADTKLQKSASAKTFTNLSIRNNYDLSSIMVGQTCNVSGTRLDSEILPENMLITSITREPESAMIRLENNQDELDELIKLIKVQT